MSRPKAQIKRATLLAHRAVEALDAESSGALADLYRAQAADIAARIRAHAGADDNIALQELQSLLDQVNGILSRLTSDRDALFAESLRQAADYGSRPVLGAVLESGTVQSTAASMQVAEEALGFVRRFVAADGLQLSDRIWRMDRGARDAVVNAIESAVIQGHGAAQAAREFLGRGQPVPIDVQDKLSAAGASGIARQATDPLISGAGSALDNAMRLFRTEINRAHGEAYMMSGAGHPDFAGFRYLLSPAHPKPDICDLLSTQNLHGLGQGVYPSREKTPWPAHPNTLSFLEIVFKDEITDADRAGKETPVQALARLTPEQREGALGKGKAAVFDDGKLTQGMIRAPLKAVRARLEKQGADLRDALTQQYFNGRDITIGGFFRETALPGGQLDRASLPLLLGAPDGSHIHVTKRKSALEFEIRHPLFERPASYLLDAQGILHGIDMYLRPDAPSGLGTLMFSRTVFAAQALGIKEIQIVAAGKPDNGYYTWPRLGYDAPLSAAARLRAEQAGYPGVETVLDIMSTALGRAWWRENGSRSTMVFSLDAGSRSMKVLSAYLAKRGITP